MSTLPLCRSASTPLYYTALHFAALYCAVLYCTALRFPVLHCTSLPCTALYCTAPYCTVLYCPVLYCITLTCLHCTALHLFYLFSPPLLFLLISYLFSLLLSFLPSGEAQIAVIDLLGMTAGKHTSQQHTNPQYSSHAPLAVSYLLHCLCASPSALYQPDPSYGGDICHVRIATSQMERLN